jgi:hypothetical protein
MVAQILSGVLGVFFVLRQFCYVTEAGLELSILLAKWRF